MDSDYTKTTLPNGLRIVTSEMPHTLSATINILIGAGSRYEEDQIAGISHFVEHLCFKGTEKYPLAKDISEAIEGIGGILNGGTDKELTTYWCKMARIHFDLALDVLADMILTSKLSPEDVEKERKVILEELNMIMDSPQQRVDTLIDEVIWPSQPLGRDVAGTRDTVSGIDREMALKYMGSQYSPDNAVVSVAGSISHEEVVERIDRMLGGWQRLNPATWYPAHDEQMSPRLRLEPRKTEQAHLCLAVRGLSSLHPDRFTLDLLNVILGEGMSSRLFLEIRERLGLAYDIHSYVNHYLDTGSVIVYAGVDPKRIEATIGAILAEFNRLKADIPATELTKAKEMSKGRLILRMEDSRSVANWMGGQELLLGKIRTLEEVLAIIDAITPADLQRIAQELFVTEELNLAVVGPVRNPSRLEPLLQL